jgi:hypothetical protein
MKQASATRDPLLFLKEKKEVAEPKVSLLFSSRTAVTVGAVLGCRFCPPLETRDWRTVSPRS